MKKFINLLFLSILAFAFLGCNQPTGPSEEELQKQRKEQEKLELEQRILNRKKEIWNAIEGVWKLKSNFYNNPSPIYENVIIATDSFTIDGVQQSINLDTDAVLATELPEDDIYGYAEWQEHEDCFNLVINFKNVRLSIGTYRNDPVLKIIRRNGNPDDDALFEYVRAGSQDKDDEGDEGDSSGDNEGEVTELDGTYSYSDSKYNGSSITFNWKASGMDMSETFTITNSGSSSKWVSSETQISNFFMMLFGVIDLELELTKE